MTVHLPPSVSIKNKCKDCSIVIKHFKSLYRRDQDNNNRETEEEQETKEKNNLNPQYFFQCCRVGSTSSPCSHNGTRRDKKADTCVDLALHPSAKLKSGKS